MDAEVLPYHWDDRQKLYADYQELQAFYERLLPDVAEQLNQIHGVSHGVRYWRILIGPWLNCFAQVMFDRWTTIQQAIKDYDISGVRVLEPQQMSFVPNCMANYTDIVLGDQGNEQIYATILQQYTDVPCQVIERHFHEENAPVGTPSEGGMRYNLINTYERLARLFARDTDGVIFMADQPFANIQKLLLRFRQVPQIWRAPSPDVVEADPRQRQWWVKGDNQSPFEAALRSLIPQYIPTAYLEGYSRLVKKAQDMSWPKRPKFIYTTTGQYTMDVFKAWAAEKVQAGTKLVIGQHGGQYGIGLWVIHEDHETAIADRFLTWGWSDADNPKVRPVGVSKAVRPLGVHHAQQSKALLVTASLPRYSYWLRSITIARQWLDNFEDQCSFIDSLPGHIRDAVIVRLHHKNYDWDQEGRFKSRFPDLKLDRCEQDMNDLIAQSRVYITTYNATTYLESFAMNVPTVIYWDPNHWELRESAKPYFEGLKQVGIFHETPQSAARHVALIWDDVDAWWNSPEVRAEVSRFSQYFGRLPDDPLGTLEAALRDVMNAPATA